MSEAVHQGMPMLWALIALLPIGTDLGLLHLTAVDLAAPAAPVLAPFDEVEPTARAACRTAPSAPSAPPR